MATATTSSLPPPSAGWRRVVTYADARRRRWTVDPSVRSVAHARARLRDFRRLLGGTHVAVGILGALLAQSSLEAATGFAVAGAVHVAVGTVLLLASRLVSTRKLEAGRLAALDLVSTVLGTAVVVASTSLAHLRVAGTAVGMLLTLVLMLRAAVVTSGPRRTWVVGVATVASTVGLAMALGTFHHDGHRASLVEYGAFTVYALLVVAISTKVSIVIHGLEESVEAARSLGQYVLVDRIGSGGMGSVWTARHAMLKRTTAVKLMHTDRTSEADIARFEREVQLTSRLTHPNTVAVFDYGRTDDGRLYYAMEHVDGPSLEQLVDAEGPQPAARVVHLLRQVADALSEAHGLGVVHRDVKPANVLVATRGGIVDFVKVVDFGLVHALSPEPSGRAERSDANLVVGTPDYLAPEMILHPAEVDGRADLYALGAVGFFLLTGRPVFEGAGLVEIAAHHLHTRPRPPGLLVPGVPAELDDLLLRCLAKAPEARPASAAALRDELAALAAQSPWTPVSASSAEASVTSEASAAPSVSGRSSHLRSLRPPARAR